MRETSLRASDYTGWLKEVDVQEYFSCPFQSNVFTFDSQRDITLCIPSVAGIRSGVLSHQVVNTKLMKCCILLQVILETRLEGHIVFDPGNLTTGVRDGAGQSDRFTF